jgi:perosamine synthetase
MSPPIPIACPSIGAAERRAVLDVLDSGQLTQGEQVAGLESELAEMCGARHAVATSSGTTALHLALLAHGIGPGDEVITTPFSFVATANSILQAGATPVFVDVEPASGNLDATLVERAVTPRTRAVLPVHLYGQMCDMGALTDIAQRHGLVVIEDACQAIGARFEGRPAGGFATAAFSFYATKNVAAGEGGAITTDDDGVADRCRLLRNHGMRRRYEYEGLGFNFRMGEIAAAIARVQLGRHGELQERRLANAAFFGDRITSVETPRVLPGRDHAWHQYTVRANGSVSREMARCQLERAGIGVGVFYPRPLHRIDHVRAVAGEVSLPVAEQLAGCVLSLPVHPMVSSSQRDAIVRTVNRLELPC